MHGKRLAKYLLLTFAISYACWGGLAVLIRLGAFCFTDPPAVVLHLLGGFGPAFAALARAGNEADGKGCAALCVRLQKEIRCFSGAFLCAGDSYGSFFFAGAQSNDAALGHTAGVCAGDFPVRRGRGAGLARRDAAGAGKEHARLRLRRC